MARIWVKSEQRQKIYALVMTLLIRMSDKREALLMLENIVTPASRLVYQAMSFDCASGKP